MLTSGDRLALLPVLLLLGAAVNYLLPKRLSGAGRIVGAATLLGGLGLAVSLLPAVAGTATVERSYGNAVPGVEVLLRGDAPGMVVVVSGMVAALFALGGGSRVPRESAAILLCATGTALAGLAGNAVLLFGGAEIGNLASFLLLAGGKGRVSRGVLGAFVVQHVFALGLLLAAVELVAIAGTSDPRALPPDIVGAQLGLPWAFAGAVRLLALGIGPGAGDVRASRAWAAISAVPCGAAILLRLIEAGGGPLSLGIGIPLAAFGGATALWGGSLAWRWQRDPRLAGRGLVIAATGPVIALAGLPGGVGGFSAGLVALEVTLLAAPAWSHSVSAGLPGRLLAALALAAAGGLPLGFGATATVLELGPVAALGRPYIALLAVLGVAAVLTAAAGLAAARHALDPTSSVRRPIRIDAAIAMGLGGLAATLPGAVGVLLLTPLAGSAAPTAVDAASLRGPGGAWPGGYLSLGLLVAAATLTSAWILSGRGAPLPVAESHTPSPLPPWPHLLRPRRRLAPVIRVVPRVLTTVDRWLVPQPQLGFAMAAAAIALFLFR